MRIVIHSIDTNSLSLRGVTPTPSFSVKFSSQPFSGTARLVPAVEISDVKTGAEFQVEIAQESVTGFRLSEMSGDVYVEPILPLGDFQVRGIVRFLLFPAEPVGNRITYIQAGEADFCLALKDIGDLRPEVGTIVEFIVHDLSLWDYAI